MGDILEVIITIFIVVLFTFGPLAIWYWIGKHFENKHFESIKQREAKHIQMSLVPSDLVDREKPIEAMAMVTGGVVIGSDPFKRYVATLVNLIGGRISVFEPLLDRARREAVLRMKEKAAAIRADEVVNFRMETMSISGGKDGKPQGIVEVLAYGTAIRYGKTTVK